MCASRSWRSEPKRGGRSGLVWRDGQFSFSLVLHHQPPWQVPAIRARHVDDPACAALGVGHAVMQRGSETGRARVVRRRRVEAARAQNTHRHRPRHAGRRGEGRGSCCTMSARTEAYNLRFTPRSSGGVRGKRRIWKCSGRTCRGVALFARTLARFALWQGLTKRSAS